jgi:hypothetical protein
MCGSAYQPSRVACKLWAVIFGKGNYTHLPKDFLTSNLAFPNGRQAVRAGIVSFRADYLQNKMQGGKGWWDVGHRRFWVWTLNAVRRGFESLRPMGLIAFPFCPTFNMAFSPRYWNQCVIFLISRLEMEYRCQARYVTLPSSSSLAD